MDCLSGRGHIHHSACQVKTKDGVYLCPHCGEKSSQVPVSFSAKRETDSQRAKVTAKK